VVGVGYWILLGLVIMLVGWAAWRQRRYGGSTHYDRDGKQSELWHRSEYNPWGQGNRKGDGKDSS
jgi:hypothetical protein